MSKLLAKLSSSDNSPVSALSDDARSGTSLGFSCPLCRGALRASTTSLSCASCARDYPIVNGIVDFRCHRHDYYFNPVPPKEMGDLLQAISSVPWDDTIRRFLKSVKNVPEWIDNVEVDGRYTWKLLLDLPERGRFLDFGCGLGNLAHNIAAHVGETVALDLTWERLLFAKERFAKFNPSDKVRLVAGGDGPFLPFPDDYFDNIALSGVLEWIADDSSLIDQSRPRIARVLQMLGSFFGETNPRKTQIRFLKELRRVLKPEGQLFIAIENRCSFEYFLGHPDHHSGLMYASLLPRFAANLYSIVRSRQPYRTYTHGYGGFRRLLAAAGLPKQEFYGLSPGYSGLSEIIPAKSVQPFWRAGPVRNIKEWITRSRYFVPAYGIIAGHDGIAPTSLLARLLDELRTKLGANAAPITLDRLVVTGKDKVVLSARSDAIRLFIKIPMNASALADEENNWAFLSNLSGHRITASCVPAPLARGCHQKVHYFVERALDGQPLSAQLPTLTRASVAGIVTRWLLGMHPGPVQAGTIGSEGDAYHSLVLEPLAKLRAAALGTSDCERLELAFRERIQGSALRLGLTHGDFTSDNILVHDGKISGVIDWGYATSRGLAVLDMLAYVEGNQRVLEPGTTVAENLVRLSRRDWSCQEELDAVDQTYRHFGFDPELHGLACELCWLHHMAQQLVTSARFDQGRLEASMKPMLDHLLRN